MTATNHAVTGAIVGLAVANPLLAIPLAFVSHFALDAIPHFDPPGNADKRIATHDFRKQLLLDALCCGALVLALFLTGVQNWLNAAICAFAAASPDLFWIPKFIRAQKGQKQLPLRNPFLVLHSKVQWLTGPKLWPVEAVWLIAVASIVFFLTSNR